MYNREEVEKANIELSRILADKYNETEPHYKPENKAIVKAKLEELQERTKGSSLLDMGCGTGFIIDLAKIFFETVIGVDISQEMLNKVDKGTDRDRIRLFNCNTRRVPVGSNCTDVCTAYSLLHHLHNIEPTLKEAFRVLKPGGIFWSALDPNYYFLQSLKDLPEYNNTTNEYSRIIARELEEIDKRRRDPFFKKAEPLKYVYGGFKENDLRMLLHRVGFSNVEVEYYWFLGEREYIRREEGQAWIENYLQDTLPLSRHLFKYLSITAVK